MFLLRYKMAEEKTGVALYDELRALVESIDEDFTKALEGNKSASTRLRKTMQAVKAKAQEIRKASLGWRVEK